MRILLLATSFNSLTQRLHVELRERGHTLAVELDVAPSVTEEALRLFAPDLVLAPFLRRAVPPSVWRAVRTLIVHPGPLGDRGPSSLDWAIQEGATEWGVTVLEATDVMDGGPVWSSVPFAIGDRTAATRMRTPPSKSSLYRNEMTEAAVEAVLLALDRIAAGATPRVIDDADPTVLGRARRAMRQDDRRIDWRRDSSARILATLRAADGQPGVLDTLYGEPVYLHDAHPEDVHVGYEPGAIIGKRNGAILRATLDGALWIGHLRRADATQPTLKLPAVDVLGDALVGVPEIEAPATTSAATAASARTYRDLWYEETDGVGILHFPFYNGAMSSAQCRRLRDAFLAASARPTRVIVLAGGPDFWSNGIHLNTIEAAAAPADESWTNISAIDDLALAILTCTSHLTVAAMAGNAGAGGVFLALAADRIWARSGLVLNPHYKSMGNLYGSEYWTYSLPKRVGVQAAGRLTQLRLPIGAREAARLGLVDDVFETTPERFLDRALVKARALVADAPALLEAKARRRAEDERIKPLADYRAEELARMRLNFYGFDPSYHVARYHFVFKLPRSRTPSWLAPHRAPQPTLKEVA